MSYKAKIVPQIVPINNDSNDDVETASKTNVNKNNDPTRGSLARGMTFGGLDHRYGHQQKKITNDNGKTVFKV